MKEYRVRCDRIRISKDGKETRRSDCPVTESRVALDRTFETYEKAWNYLEDSRATSDAFENFMAQNAKRYPALYTYTVRYENFRIEEREVTEWHQ